MFVQWEAFRAISTRLEGILGIFALSLVTACWLSAPGTAIAQADVSNTGSIGGIEAKFIDVKGVRTRYYDEGQGEPLVLVHGSGWRGTANANTWVRNIPGLSERFRVIAVDKLGAGMTGNPLDDKDYNMQGMVNHLYEFIQAMNLGEIHLMGQSNGGAVVFLTAVAHPEIIKTLIIVNSGPAAPRVGSSGREDALRPCRSEDWVEEWTCTYRALSYDPSHVTEDFLAASIYMQSLPKAQETAAKRAAGAGAPHFYSPESNAWLNTVHERVKTEGTLQMPVLLYWSRNDPNSPVGSPGAREASALFDVIGEKNPRVRMFIANKAGHFHYREYPEEFNWNVINFIDYWNAQPADR